MNILTDILSLIQRGKFTNVAGKDDVVVLGMWNEKPEMTGVASPIPYKSVKLIKVKDLASSENCDYTNTNTTSTSIGVFQKEDIDPATGKCAVFFRSLKSLSPNLTIQLSADDDYIEFDSEGEPNLAANVGSGKEVWKDKVGETLNFRTLVEGSGITIGQSTNEITISAADNDTTYTYTSSQSGVNVDLKLTGSDGSLGNVKLVAGNNITLADSGSNEITINSTGGGGGGADFLVNGDTLTIEGGTGIETVGTGGPKVVVNLTDTTVVPGAYTNTDLTVDQQGRITAASSGTKASFSVYDENPGGAGPGFTVDDGSQVLIYHTPTIGAITGVPLGSTANNKSIALSLNWDNYVALLSQGATNPPVENVLLDNGVPPITWTYLAPGQYQATFSNALADVTKVSFNISQKFSSNVPIPYIASIVEVTPNGFIVKTFRADTGAEVNDVLKETPLEIKVYP